MKRSQVTQATTDGCTHHLTLACGHKVLRRVKRRRQWVTIPPSELPLLGSMPDPAPRWVYCEFCDPKSNS